MSQQTPCLDRRFRLQWEDVQQAYVLLYPEGMVRLNDSAAQVLKRCDGQRTRAEITAALMNLFENPAIDKDVQAFIDHAFTRGWLC